MVRILVNVEGYVDFEAPVQMTDEQGEKFISFLKGIFPDLKTREVKEKTKSVGGREFSPKKWSVDECYLLLSPDFNAVLGDKMSRSEMSVRMERGHFVPEFLCWAKKKGYSFPVSKKVVQEFIEERGR
jgi:hypothetical protein